MCRWEGVSENTLQKHLEEYSSRLSHHIKLSLPPIKDLLTNVMSAYDPHFLVFKEKNNKDGEVMGLLAFNHDTMVQKQTSKQSKINLYHISCINETQLEYCIDKGLEYIWKFTHC